MPPHHIRPKQPADADGLVSLTATAAAALQAGIFRLLR